MNKQKLVISSAYGAILSIVFVVVITIWAEFSAPLKNWLTNFSGHHWTSKSIFSVLIYVIATLLLYLLPQNKTQEHIKNAVASLLVFVILGTIALTLFFTGHNFHFF